jgi:DNA-binding MarR family transcriptional regulator
MTVGTEFRSHDSINDLYLWGLLEHARSIVFRARELELSQCGITIEQMSILHALLIHGGTATLDQIATTIIRQYNSVSTIVNRMSALGLVKKEKLKHERKSKVCITEKARHIVITAPGKSIQMVFSKLTPEDKVLLATSLEQIVSTGHDIMGHNFSPAFMTNRH